MKKAFVFLFAFLLLLSAAAHAQREYWGVATNGGSTFQYTPATGITNDGMGTIFKTDKDGHNLQLVHSFDSATGFDRMYTLTRANNGKLYGITGQIGDFSDSTIGVIYELDPTTSEYKIVHYFTLPIYGYYAKPGKLFMGRNGKLYGFTITRNENNNNNYNTLYSFDPDTYAFTKLYNFTDGSSFFQEMAQGADGNIYFTFEVGGGPGTQGIIYKYNPSNNTAVKLYTFINNSGFGPYAAMIEYSPGIFYGCLLAGSGNVNKGGIYQFNANTNTYTLKARMDTINGKLPACNLVRVGNKLYGTTMLGGSTFDYGILFEYDPITEVLKNVHVYDPQIYYIDPYLANNSYNDQNGQSVSFFAQDSLLYGLTSLTIFSYNPYTGQFTTLEPMTAWKERYAVGSLIQTCSKPYLRTPTQDTINVPLGLPFNYNIQSPNSSGFQWIKGGTNYPDTDSILNFSSFTFSDTGRYRCKLTNECGDSITKAIYLTSHILPVQLLSFKATLQNQQTLLNWTTAQEVNNRHFIIERSRDGSSFTTIGKVKGHGTTTQPHNYQYTDENTPDGISYYRLQQVDNDGKVIYSKVELINKANGVDLSISPNPASSKVLISFTRTQPSVKIDWINAAGQVVQTNAYKNMRQQSISIGRLSAGVYTVRVTTTAGMSYHQVIKKTY